MRDLWIPSVPHPPFERKPKEHKKKALAQLTVPDLQELLVESPCQGKGAALPTTQIDKQLQAKPLRFANFSVTRIQLAATQICVWLCLVWLKFYAQQLQRRQQQQQQLISSFACELLVLGVSTSTVASSASCGLSTGCEFRVFPARNSWRSSIDRSANPNSSRKVCDIQAYSPSSLVDSRET